VKKAALGWLVITAGLLPAYLPAQSPQLPQPAAPARSLPRPDDIEPGVDTSADEHRAAPAPAAPAADAQGARTARSKAKAGTKPAPETAATGKATSGKATSGKSQDRLQLDASEITGNRELPKVMVIVPWKRADLGDLADKPMNSLIDEVLQPIDRDVFQRQTRYYDALKPDAAPAAGASSTPPAAPQGH
jgi:hypothetical protein